MVETLDVFFERLVLIYSLPANAPDFAIAAKEGRL